MFGGTSYSLDLSGVPADDRPALVAGAMEWAQDRLAAGAGFDFSGAAGLAAARYIPFVTLAAAMAVEGMNGLCRQLRIRARSTMPLGLTNISFVNRLPDGLLRMGIGKALPNSAMVICGWRRSSTRQRPPVRAAGLYPRCTQCSCGCAHRRRTPSWAACRQHFFCIDGYTRLSNANKQQMVVKCQQAKERSERL
jgi:hypothetical protein